MQKKSLRPLISLLLIVVFSTTGCQKPSAPSEATESKYFVNGDPLEIIQGTDLNPKSFLTKDNYQELNHFEISGAISFTEKSLKSNSDQTEMEEVKKKNATPTELKENDKAKTAEFRLDRNSSGVNLLILSIATGSGSTELVFHESVDQQRFELKAIKKDSKEAAVEALHYSITPDKNAFSFLFHGQSEGENALVAIAFHKTSNKPKKLEATESARDYYYLLGKGVLVGQNQSQPLVINACGAGSAEYKSTVEAAIKPWQNALKDRLNVVVNFKSRCKPILDVNSQSIQFIPNRITRISPKLYNPGATIPRRALSYGEMTGADILIFLGEYKRMISDLLAEKPNLNGQTVDLRPSLQPTLTHEFGHLLGLGHPFDSKHSSIMGYDDSVKTLTSYDVSAIQMLYPLKEK